MHLAVAPIFSGLQLPAPGRADGFRPLYFCTTEAMWRDSDLKTFAKFSANFRQEARP